MHGVLVWGFLVLARSGISHGSAAADQVLGAVYTGAVAINFSAASGAATAAGTCGTEA